MATKKEKFIPKMFQPFLKDIEKARKRADKALGYNTRRAIGRNALLRIAQTIPEAHGLRTKTYKNGKEEIYIDFGDPYAYTLYYSPNNTKGKFKFGSMYW